MRKEMEILNDVIEIIGKYDLKPITLPDGVTNLYSYLRGCTEEKEKYINKSKNDLYFLKKYKQHITKGHYGFNLGEPIIPEWCDIIDEILELCIKTDPDFEIQQIKIKFGFVCFYTRSEVISDLNKVESYIANNLKEKKLIY